MEEKRVIEQTASSEIYNDDWFLKDSVLEGTTKISKDNLIDKIGASKIKSIAEDYDSTSTYNKDDFAFYENKLYRCLANNTTGTWDGTKWEEFDLPTALITTAHNIDTAEFTIGTYYSADDLVLKDGKLYQCVVGHNATEWKSQFWRSVTIDEMLGYLSDSIAPEHNQSTVYAVGDLVMHNKILWRCIQAGAGAFVNANWEEVTVADLIAEAGQIDDVQVKTTGNYETVVENKIAKIDLSSVTAYGEVPNLPQAIATFKDGADAPMKSLKVAIEPQQEGSGDPSLTNVRPISGWDEVNMVDDAVYGGYINWNQLADKSLLRESGTVGDLTLTNNNDGYLYISGSITNSFVELSGNLTLNYIKGHKYLFNIPTAPSNVNLLLTLYGTAFGNFGLVSATIKECNNTLSERIYPRFGTSNSVSVNNFKYYIGVIDLTQMFGSTIADYIYSLEQTTAGSGVAYFKSLFYKDYYPYNSGEITNVSAVNGDTDKYSTYTIDLDGTRYGGEVDVVNGGGTDRLGYVDLSEVTATYNSDWNCWIIQPLELPNAKIIDNNNTPTTAMTDRFKAVKASGYTTAHESGTIAQNTSGIWFIDNGSTTELSGQLVYELATPLTIQLTPTQVKSLLGQNNIWADTGDINECIYQRDMNTTINDIIARIEALEG